MCFKLLAISLADLSSWILCSCYFVQPINLNREKICSWLKSQVEIHDGYLPAGDKCLQTCA